MFNLEDLFDKNSRDDFYNYIEIHEPEDAGFYKQIINNLYIIEGMKAKKSVKEELYKEIGETIHRHYELKDSEKGMKKSFDSFIKIFEDFYKTIADINDCNNKNKKDLFKIKKNSRRNFI